MKKIDLYYVNSEYRSLVDFTLFSRYSFDNAIDNNPVSQAVPLLLDEIKFQVEEFGKTISIPENILNTIDLDDELNYILKSIDSDVDAFIENHIFVTLPRIYSNAFIDLTKESVLWRSNGMGLSRMLLLSKEDEQLNMTVPLYKDLEVKFQMIKRHH